MRIEGTAKKTTANKGQKRKFEMADALSAFDMDTEPMAGAAALGREAIRSLIDTIKADNTRGASETRHATRKAAHQLAEFAKKEDYIDIVVSEGAIESCVPLLLAVGPAPPAINFTPGMALSSFSIEQRESISQW